MAVKSSNFPPSRKRPLDPFRRAVLRGLAVLLPPLLTIVIFVWIGNTVITYMLEPLEKTARSALLEYATDIRPDDAAAEPVESGEANSRLYRISDALYFRTDDDKYIPAEVRTAVRQQLGNKAMPGDARDIYLAYIDHKYLQRRFVIPVFLGVFILVLYLLGKFLAAGMGRFLWRNWSGS